MKYLKTFESVKDIYVIEDLLLKFVDSAEIEDLEVVHNYNNFKINFDINESIVGMNKVILIDKILTRLKNKYPYIYISRNEMYIEIKPVDNTIYISENLITQVNKMIDDNFSSLRKKNIDNCISFCKNKKIIFKFNLKDVYISSKVWHLFTHKFMLNYDDTEIILGDYIKNMYNIKFETVFCSTMF